MFILNNKRKRFEMKVFQKPLDYSFDCAKYQDMFFFFQKSLTFPTHLSLTFEGTSLVLPFCQQKTLVLH